jgi:hypothetical protein
MDDYPAGTGVAVDTGAAPATAGPASQSAPRWSASSWNAARALRAIAAAAGLIVIVTYVGIAVSRIGFPGHLEILEENSLAEVHRILAGQQLYPAPSASYVPDGYTPLYFALSAAVASVLGQSYLPLRLVSLLASLACFAILGRLVHRETGSRAAGMAAAGLLASTYFVTDTWFDVGRVDSLFLAFSVAGLYAARWACRTSGAVTAGLLLGAAFLTKQTGLAEGIAVLAAMAIGSRRRLAGPAAAAWAVVVGGSTLALGLSSHGWYLYYVFEQMSQHALNSANVSSWFSELLPILGIALCAMVLGVRRTPLLLLAGCAALAVESFAARAQDGSNVNDLLPAYTAVAILAGLALGARPALARFTRWRRDAGERWLPVAVSGLVLVQIGVLASGFHLSRALPPNADLAADQRLTAVTRALGGTVAIPDDPGIALMAGRPTSQDHIASTDVQRASDGHAKTLFMTSLTHAVHTQQYSAIITEYRRDLQGYPADLPDYYRKCPQTPWDGLLSIPFSAGAKPLPVTVWLPIGHGPSCATVARTLES